MRHIFRILIALTVIAVVPASYWLWSAWNSPQTLYGVLEKSRPESWAAQAAAFRLEQLVSAGKVPDANLRTFVIQQCSFVRIHSLDEMAKISYRDAQASSARRTQATLAARLSALSSNRSQTLSYLDLAQSFPEEREQNTIYCSNEALDLMREHFSFPAYQPKSDVKAPIPPSRKSN